MSERLERIEKYLEGAMSPEEKLHFESELRTDPALQDTFHRIRIINAGLEVSISDDLKSKFKGFETVHREEHLRPKVRKVQAIYSRLSIAAGVLLLITAGLWLIFGAGNSKVEKYAQQHYISYDYSQLRGDQNRSHYPVGLGKENGDQKESAEWLLEWLEMHPDDHEARFILADIYKEMAQPEKAKGQLAILMSKNSVLWSEKAQWNYVLISSTGRWDDLAEKTLQNIKNDPGHSYHHHALDLMVILQKQ